MSKLEEIEKRRSERRAASDEKRVEQEEKDLEAIEKIEIAEDVELHTLSVPNFVPGLPVRVAYKAPSAEFYKRFSQQVRRAGTNGEARGAAQELLGESCWVYPAADEQRKAMKLAFPGTLISIAIKAAALAELTRAEEGKD